jgi:hypothetical protein
MAFVHGDRGPVLEDADGDAATVAGEVVQVQAVSPDNLVTAVIAWAKGVRMTGD